MILRYWFYLWDYFIKIKGTPSSKTAIQQKDQEFHNKFHDSHPQQDYLVHIGTLTFLSNLLQHPPIYSTLSRSHAIIRLSSCDHFQHVVMMCYPLYWISYTRRTISAWSKYKAKDFQLEAEPINYLLVRKTRFYAAASRAYFKNIGWLRTSTGKILIDKNNK